MSTPATSRLRTPRGAGSSVAAGVVLALLAILGGEAWLRAQGYAPSLRDDEQLWAVHRDRIVGADRSTVVTVGASRIQLDLSSAAFHARFPELKLVRLEVAGEHPLPTLLHLAESDDTAATFIVSLRPGLILSNDDSQREGVEAWHAWTDVGAEVERRINAAVQSVSVIASLRVRRDPLWPALMGPGLASVAPAQRMLPDRSIVSDYTRVDLELERQARLDDWGAPSPRQRAMWDERVDAIKAATAAIQARGGAVVYVMFPVCGPLRELEDEAFPRERYWDDFAARVGAPTVHYADIPGMAALDCPDWSHLDMRDAPTFTELLLDELERQGVLPP